MKGEARDSEKYHHLTSIRRSRAEVAHACNPSTWEAEASEISEFEASLVYRVRMSSRTARETWLEKPKKLCMREATNSAALYNFQ